MFKITKLSTLFIFCIVVSVSYSQDKTIDSLKLIVQNPKIHDTVKLYSLLTAKSQKYSETDERAFTLNHMQGKYAMECLKKKVSPEIRKIYVQCLADYYSSLMTEYRVKGDIPKALAAIDKSIALFKSEKLYSDMYYAVMDKGRFYAKIQEYEKATACLFDALRYFEKHPGGNPVVEVGSVYSSLASLYWNQGNNEKAIEYNKKVIACCDANKSLEYSEGTDRTKFGAYSTIGVAYRNLEKYNDAIDSFNKALEIAKKLEDTFRISYALSRIGSVKLAQLKYDEAEVYFKEALKGDLNERALANGYTSMAQFYFAKKDYDKANFFITKGLELSIKINNVDLQETGSDLLFKVSSIRKDYKTALEMYQLYHKIIDSKKIETSKNALEQQQLKYDFEKRELKLKLDSEKKNAVKNNWLIGLSGVLLLLLLGVFFYYRNNKQKQAIASLEKDQIKQKLLITQMNPHFIFNSIDNIQGLIHEKKDTDAVNYLTKFSKLTRQILENSNENYISLAEEIEMTRNYMAIQQLLYDNKFSFSIAIEDTIDEEAIFLPPMLTQPFIENAIKHGLSNTLENGKIAIHFSLKEGKLFFEVADNGKGFDTTQKTTNHKSLAMTITKERLVGYTKNQDFIVQTDNIKDSNENVVGAKVSFEIPYIYEN